MRRTNLGIIGVDIALSISHDLVTGSTSALVLGLSDRQAAYVRYQLEILAPLATHPLLLPTLICAYFRTALERYTKDLWDRLLKLEQDSGQTGVPLYNQHGFLPSGLVDDYTILTKEVLGIIQLSSSWQNWVQGLLYTIEAIQECNTHINSLTLSSRIVPVKEVGDMLLERLRFLSHKSNMMQYRLQYITQRAQAQMTAVSNHSYWQHKGKNTY